MRTTKTLEAPWPVNAAVSRLPGYAAVPGPGRVAPRQVPGPGAQTGDTLAQAGKPGAGPEKTERK